MYKTLIFIMVLLSACNGTNTSNHKAKGTSQNNKNETVIKKQFNPKVNIKLLSKAPFHLGDDIKLSFDSKVNTNPDSIILTVNQHSEKVSIDDKKKINLTLENIPLGKQQMRFKFHWGDTLSQSKNINITVLSDIEPKLYGYKIIEEFKHDTKAYTQGLEFDNNVLYEGTGQIGESTLTKFDLDQNKMLHQVALPSNVFGEGLTVLKDKVYQLTWRSQVGYVYNKETLNKLYEFTYPTEGWGLCNNGKQLIMSDGSEYIFFLDLSSMQETHRIQVYDNKGMVNRLNELEYIDGLIYANVYGTNNIVAFEEETGKVIKQINLKGLLNPKDVKSQVDVLNGIAYDEQKKRMVVTGKWWPKLYHVEFIAL